MENTINNNLNNTNIFLVKVDLDCDDPLYCKYNSYIEKNTKVIVELSFGTYIGKVKRCDKVPFDMLEEINKQDLYQSILRIATPKDIKIFEDNNAKCFQTKKLLQEEADKLGLKMNFFAVFYAIEPNKLLACYTADDKVDFRDLLKVIKEKTNCRIELKQVGVRDRARFLGELGTCGLPLCCKTFLTDFEGITTSLAKNQFISVINSKIQGQCSKLMCCLKFENDFYTEIRQYYPKPGDTYERNGKEYKITSVNVLNDTISIDVLHEDDAFEITKDEFSKLKEGLPFKTRDEIVPQLDSFSQIARSKFADELIIKEQNELQNKNLNVSNNTKNNKQKIFEKPVTTQGHPVVTQEKNKQTSFENKTNQQKESNKVVLDKKENKEQKQVLSQPKNEIQNKQKEVTKPVEKKENKSSQPQQTSQNNQKENNHKNNHYQKNQRRESTNPNSRHNKNNRHQEEPAKGMSKSTFLGNTLKGTYHDKK